MNLKLLYITNDSEIAVIAENAGVDRIFVDLETIGKHERQHGRDTVKSQHRAEDAGAIKSLLKSAELLVRINPIYGNTKQEIDKVIQNGADIIMLPMIKTVDEVKTLLRFVDGRCRTCMLIETKESVDLLDEIIKVAPDSEYFIGLNDLHLSYQQDFMFEPLANGTVEEICHTFQLHHIPLYGFGGIARVGEGELPAESIIAEHHRLGSGMVILSRTFCDVRKFKTNTEIKMRMESGVRDIRAFEDILETYTKTDFIDNQKIVSDKVKIIAEKIKDKKS